MKRCNRVAKRSNSEILDNFFRNWAKETLLFLLQLFSLSCNFKNTRRKQSILYRLTNLYYKILPITATTPFHPLDKPRSKRHISPRIPEQNYPLKEEKILQEERRLPSSRQPSEYVTGTIINYPDFVPREDYSYFNLFQHCSDFLFPKREERNERGRERRKKYRELGEYEGT